MPREDSSEDYLIGEALIGKEPEVAHVDLIMGSKIGQVGLAFANSMTQLSVGHTPLLAIIRPNLVTKPHTLIVPKVTIKDLDQATKIFGPAQTAVAKAVADSVDEGIIPEGKLDEWVIIVGVFIHPEAKDFRKIYQYNYGATKLAVRRALSDYPSKEKLLYEKDRATHPIMGFKVPRLWMPPYLLVNLDIPNIDKVKTIIQELPPSDRLILEAGAPLIKKYGLKVIKELREFNRESFICADLQTLDLGQVEVDIAFDETADGVTVSGLASKETLNNFIYEAKKQGMYAMVDMKNVAEPIGLIKSFKELPDVVILGTAADRGTTEKGNWSMIKRIKDTFKGKKLLVGVSGGIDLSIAPQAISAGADILMVSRYITQSKNVTRTASDLLKLAGLDMDVFRVHVE